MSTATLAVVPCSAAKLDDRAPAADLYVGSLTRSGLLAGEALQLAGVVDRVLILSALHGLVELTDELDPYDVTFGDAEAIRTPLLGDQLVTLHGLSVPDDRASSTELLARHQLRLLPLLPRAYDTALSRAVLDAQRSVDVVALDNPLTGARGLLTMRRTLRELREAAAL